MMIQALTAVASVVAMGLVGLSMTDRAHQATVLPMTRAAFDESVAAIRFSLADSSTCIRFLRPDGGAQFRDDVSPQPRALILDSESQPLSPPGSILSGLKFNPHELSLRSKYGAPLTDGTQYYWGALRVSASRAPATSFATELSEEIPVLLQFDQADHLLKSCSTRAEWLQVNALDPLGPRTALSCLDRGGTPEPASAPGINPFYCRYLSPDPNDGDAAKYCPLEQLEKGQSVPASIRWKKAEQDAVDKGPAVIGVSCD